MYYEIKSSADAAARSKKLKSWSEESLSLALSDYVASLLERTRGMKRARKPTKWNAFISKALKQGKSIQEAAAEYKGGVR